MEKLRERCELRQSRRIKSSPRIGIFWPGNGSTRASLARGKQDDFLRSEAEEVLTWYGIELRLDGSSATWSRSVRALQEASVEAYEAIRQRDKGDVVPKPDHPAKVASTSSGSSPLLSDAVRSWEAEKRRGAWPDKLHNDHTAWMSAFISIAGDKPIADYIKEDARAFKEVLPRLPANWRKKPEVRHLRILQAAEQARKLGLEAMSIATLNKAIRRVAAFWNWAEAHFDGVLEFPRFRGRLWALRFQPLSGGPFRS